jgi:transposase
LYKRLERGTFRVPRPMSPSATSVTIEASELARILEGIDLPPSRRRSRVIPGTPPGFPAS